MDTYLQTVGKAMEPVEGFASSGLEDTVGSVVDKLQSSHDAVLVYSNAEQQILAGILANTPTANLKSLPHNAKVGNHLIHPPHIAPGDRVGQAVQYMLDKRVYVLPVRREGEPVVVGIVTADGILRLLQRDEESLDQIVDGVVPSQPITAPLSSTVGDIVELMDKDQISRVILTNDGGVLSGIVSRRDILDAFVKPSDRQRFSTRNGSPINYSFDEEQVRRDDDPITKYAITKVDWAPANASIRQAVGDLITGKSNSVVLVNGDHRPTGFISRKDLLRAITALQAGESQPVVFRHPDINLSDSQQARLDNIIEPWAAKLTSRVPVSQITVSYGVSKTPEGGIREVDTTLIIDPAAGPSSDSVIAKAKSRSWEDGLRSTMAIADKQFRRQHQPA